MITLLYLYFNKQNLRTRLLAGISVLAIILIIGSATFFRSFLYDPLAGYASTDTVFYLHLNLNTKDSFYRAKVIDTILEKFQLADFDRHLLKDELAVVCKQQPAINCQLVFFANNKAVTEAYLQSKQLAYQVSGFNTIIVAPTLNANSKIKKSWSPLIYWHYHGGLLKDDLTLVLNQITKPQSFKQRLLIFLQPSIRLSGNINNQGIVLKPLSFTAVKSDWQSDYLDINHPQYDLQLNLKSMSPLNSLLVNYLNSTSNGTSGELFNILAGGSLNLVLNQLGTSQELLNDYQIYLTSSAQLNDQQLTALQTVLRVVAARLTPSEKNFYLNDGSKVTVLSPNSNLNSQTTGQLFSLKLNANQLLYINSSSSGLALGNDLAFQPKLDNSEHNYGLTRISALPRNNELKNYLKEFSFFYFDDNKVIIK